MEFFSRDDNDLKKDDININQSIIDFMNQNAKEEDTSSPNEESLNKEIQLNSNQNLNGGHTHLIEP